MNGYYQFYDGFSISPEFNFSFLGRKSPDGQVISSASSLMFRVCKQALFDGIDFHLGPGFVAYRISGEGGTQDQSNGSSTSTFGIPSGKRSAVMLTLDLGVGYQMSTSRIEFSLLISEPSDSKKRTINPLLTYNMRVY